MSDIDLDAIAERWNAADQNYDLLGCQRASAEDVPALLARLAEVEAERDRVADKAMRLEIFVESQPDTIAQWERNANEWRRKEAQARAERDQLAAANDALNDVIGKLDEARVERDRYRRQAEVARADLWRLEDDFAGEEDELDEMFAKLKAHERCGLCGGFLAQWECELIARQADSPEGPASPPGSTESAEQAEVAMASADTAQAQRGVQGGAEAFGIDHPTHPGYWIEVNPSGWPHQRIAVTPGWRLAWVPWRSDGPVPPYKKPLPKVHRMQCAAITNGCLGALVWESASDETNAHMLELNGWWLDHGKWVCGLHDEVKVQHVD